jgi:hypothetical protein
MMMIQFTPEIVPLLHEPRVMPLGPGTPNVAMRTQLENSQKHLLEHAKDADFALASMAGLWLYHDFLDESHSISQDLHKIEGSYWHAILHRREPDYWNSKYWFRRVGEHPIHDKLHGEVQNLASGLNSKKWDCAAFVDLCDKNADPNAQAHDVCRQIQQIEWQLLFEYCHERAFHSDR